MTDDPIHAVLIEPQLERFRALCGLDDVPLTVSFEGWHRHAILTPDRVFLFPRDRSRVPGLRRDVAVLTALEGRGVPVPRVLGRWNDPQVSPYPFIAVSRLPGQTWSRQESTASKAQLEKMLEGLGRAIGSWHRLDRRALPRSIPRRENDIAHFIANSLARAARGAARQLGLPPGRATQWLRLLEPVKAMEPVLVHGDINEGQILVDDDLRVTGILDWETSHVGHPLKDHDFGEWGYGIFAHNKHFDALRRRLWTAYAAARGGDLPSWRTVHLFFSLRDHFYFHARASPDAWARARLETTLTLLRRLEDSSGS